MIERTFGNIQSPEDFSNAGIGITFLEHDVHAHLQECGFSHTFGCYLIHRPVLVFYPCIL
jgi:hypothetical protein